MTVSDSMILFLVYSFYKSYLNGTEECLDVAINSRREHIGPPTPLAPHHPPDRHLHIVSLSRPIASSPSDLGKQIKQQTDKEKWGLGKIDKGKKYGNRE